MEKTFTTKGLTGEKVEIVVRYNCEVKENERGEKYVEEDRWLKVHADGQLFMESPFIEAESYWFARHTLPGA